MSSSSIQSLPVKNLNDIQKNTTGIKEEIKDSTKEIIKEVSDSKNEIITKFEENKGLKPSLETNETRLGKEIVVQFRKGYEDNKEKFITSTLLDYQQKMQQSGIADLYLNSSMWGGRNTLSQIKSVYNNIINNVAITEDAVYGFLAEDIIKYGGRNNIAYGPENKYSGYVKSRDGNGNLSTIPADLYNSEFQNQFGSLIPNKLLIAIGNYIKCFSGDILLARSTTAAMNSFLNSFPFRNKDAFLTTTFHWINDGDQFDGIQARFKAYGVDVLLSQQGQLEGPIHTTEEFIQYYKNQVLDVLDSGYRPRVLILDHMHWASGLVNPIGKIATELKSYVSTLIKEGNYSKIIDENWKLYIGLDAAHTFTVQDIDLSPTGTEKDVDMLFGNFHKRAQGETNIGFYYVKNSYKNEMGLFTNNETYFYFPYEYGNSSPFGLKNMLTGVGAYYTDCMNLSPSHSPFINSVACEILNGYTNIGGPKFFMAEAHKKYKLIGQHMYKKHGRVAFAANAQSPWGTEDGKLANEDGSNLDTSLVNDAFIHCPGNITDLKLKFGNGEELVIGKTYSYNGNYAFAFGDDSLKVLSFWDEDDSSKEWKAGDIVEWNHIHALWMRDNPTESDTNSPFYVGGTNIPFPYTDIPLLSTDVKVTTFAQKMHISMMQNGLNTRNINSKIKTASQKSISGVTFGHGTSPHFHLTGSDIERINVNRFTAAQYVTIDDINKSMAIYDECYDKLVASYNSSGKTYFNSLCESGIYWGVPKENSYRFSWFCRQRIVTNVGSVGKTVYSQLGQENGVIDPTGNYRHSGGEDYADSFNHTGTSRYITNSTEWEIDPVKRGNSYLKH